MSAIIINISMTYAPQFSSMSQAGSFVLRLLEAYLTAFGIATAVSLMIFPLTSRHLLSKDIESFISAFRTGLKANMTYLQSLEESDMFAAQRTNTAGEKPPRSPEATAFIEQIEGLSALQGKLATNLSFAKREVAIGKIGPDDLQQVFRLLRECLIPAIGLSCMSDIFERTSEEAGWDRSVSLADITLTEASNEAEKARILSINQWHELMKLLREPFGSVSDVIDEGLQHVLITLDLKLPKEEVKHDDKEATGDTPKPGEEGFAAYYFKRTDEFQQSKKLMLRGWCRIHGIELPDDFFSHPDSEDFVAPSWMNAGVLSEGRKALRRQLMAVLYIEFLLHSISRRLYEFIKFVDGLKNGGKLSHKRLVVPGFKRMRKWVFASFFHQQDSDGEDNMESGEGHHNIQLGQASVSFLCFIPLAGLTNIAYRRYKKRRNPDHLPPQNAWENFTDQFRKAGHFFDSPASNFGLRVACATLSIGVASYMKETQVFFTTQRLFWAQILASIGKMNSTTGSYHTNGLRHEPFCWPKSEDVHLAHHWHFRRHDHVSHCILHRQWGDRRRHCVLLHISSRRHVHRHQTPVPVADRRYLASHYYFDPWLPTPGPKGRNPSGNIQRQAYYPVWELGLIRLATVLGGLFVAWVWTIIPYPITEHSQLRKNLGSSLYLLANYYSVRELLHLISSSRVLMGA